MLEIFQANHNASYTCKEKAVAPSNVSGPTLSAPRTDPRARELAGSHASQFVGTESETKTIAGSCNPHAPSGVSIKGRAIPTLRRPFPLVYGASNATFQNVARAGKKENIDAWSSARDLGTSRYGDAVANAVPTEDRHRYAKNTVPAARPSSSICAPPDPLQGIGSWSDEDLSERLKYVNDPSI